MSSYNSKLRDSRWQRKRLEVMERDGWECCSCGASGDGVTLNVHHIYYDKGVDPWEYPSDSLITWCEDCHKKRHDSMKIINGHLSWCTEDVYNPLLNYMNEASQMFSLIAKSGLTTSEIKEAVLSKIAEKGGGQ